MPRGWLRLVAIVGMAGVLPLAAWLFVIASLMSSGVFENQDPEDYARGDRFIVVAVVAAAATLACLIGLVWRRRVLASVGAVIVSLCAAIILVDWQTNGWRFGNHDGRLVALLLAVVSVGLVALWAAVRPSTDGPKTDR